MSDNHELLVIDDDDEICDLLSELLGDHFKVTTCNTPNEALTHVQSHSVDIILSDAVLNSSMSLEELIASIREKKLFMPIVVMSGHDKDHETVQKALDNGASGYLAKPFLNFEEIGRYLHSLLSSSK
ncbi:MAG: response regulator [Zetaproteobacteria bacterium]|nr:response regulator [Zetaproteobacteria bacterium]